MAVIRPWALVTGMAMTSDFSSTLDEKSCIKLIGQDMTRKAAEKVYQQSGLGPENVQVIELHDCFSTNELITYEGGGESGERTVRDIKPVARIFALW